MPSPRLWTAVLSRHRSGRRRWIRRAWRLVITHPSYGRRLEFRAPLPDELVTLLLDLSYEGPIHGESPSE